MRTSKIHATLALAILLGIGLQTAFAQCNAALFAGGAGTELSPYQISTPEQLQDLNKCLGDSYKNNYYVLNNDIDLASYLSGSEEGWQPIGSSNGNSNSNYFYGKFDGNGHKVSGLWINRPSQNYVGLFGYASGEIRNIGVEIDNDKGGVKGSSSVGGLVGDNNSTISDSYATGNVAGSGNVGGLVGLNFGRTISGSYATGNVTGSGSNSRVGGLVGQNYYYGTISDSYATGNVTGSGNYVGGLVGLNNNSSTVNDSYATGSVEGNGCVGGLVGDNNSTISSSYATGAVTGTGNGRNSTVGVNGVGGLAGSNSGTISNSYATGSVESNGYVGGLVGENYSNGTISDSYATGNVTGGNVGGLVGYNSSTISGSYATGNVTGSGKNVGGLVGSGGTISNSYATGSVTGTGTYSYVGGLVGSSGTVSGSYATGSVTGSGSNSRVGGLVGENYSGGAISDSYATGSVMGNLYVGGLVGYNDGSTISDSYATGSVTGTGTYSYVGGLVGLNSDGTISDSYYDKEISGKTDTGKGTGKTTAEMKMRSTYDGWDFGNIWEIDPAKNNGYPSLLWQNPGHLASATVVIIPNQIWTGNPIAPTPSATFKGSILNEGTDFDYSYDNNIQTGTATLRIVGKGSFSGQAKIAEFKIVPAACGTGFADGTGTDIDPYKITDAKSLDALSNCLGDLSLNKYYELQNDINLGSYLSNSSAGWQPISSFSGKFNGKGYKVSGLWINRPSQSGVGLFGIGGSYDGSTEIRNIGVEIDDAKGGVRGNNDVGGLAGSNSGTISSSYATGSVTGNNDVGGLAGYSSGTISSSYATGNVTGNKEVGGLVGGNSYNGNGTISDSYATGSVTGNNDVGGLVGGNSYNGSSSTVFTISNSYATGNVTGSGNYVGGLVGYNGYYSSSTISNSYATGNVTGSGNYVGGLVGSSYNGTISDSYAMGNVTGSGGVGGLVGENNSTISNSYATGNVTGSGGVGGLAGYNNSTISNSYATGSVTGNERVGGLVGCNYGNGTVYNGTINDSYATGSVTGNERVGGLVGHNYGGTISDSYAMGSVTGNNDVGGLAGSNSGTISSSYATGSVESDGYVGGLVGFNYSGGTISNSYYDKETSGRTDTGKGIGKTTAEMKTQSTYDGWDFENTWIMANGTNYLNANGYPILQWQLQDIISKYAIVSSIPPQPYDGSAKEPAFTVTFNKAVLAKGSNYTVSYSNNVKAGTAKVAITGKGSYSHLEPIETYFAITPKPLTITGVTADSREYNGTTTVGLTGGTLSGVLSGDAIGFTLGTGTIATPDAGSGKAVTTNITLTGADAGNYTLTQPTNITVAITDPTPIIPNRSNPVISSIGVKTTANAILLSNLPQGAKVEVYNLQGKRLYSAYPGNPKILKIGVQTKGMYIVKAGSQSARAVVK